MADVVSWRVIEHGWSVVDAEGNEVGKVDQITGDVEQDIFDGLTIGDGGTVLSRPRYVPSERVTEIRVGLVSLDLTPEEASQLPPYTEHVEKKLADLAPEPDVQPGGPRRGGGLMRILFGRRL